MHQVNPGRDPWIIESEFAASALRNVQARLHT
jgi:hypothetical protein